MNSAKLAMIRRLARAGDTERAWSLFNESGLAAETSHVNPFVFGAFTLVALGALLVFTMMIKVGD